MKLLGTLLILALIAGAGWYAYNTWLRPPERQACLRLAELCGSEGDAKLDQCEERLGKLEEATGEQAFGETVACVEQAETCIKATGCLAGGALRGLGQFFEGMADSVTPALERESDKAADEVRQAGAKLEEIKERALQRLNEVRTAE
jgi:predicted negative regulator of RcsB-dependent stress response